MRLLAAGICVVFALLASPARALPQIWFCPLDPLLRPEVHYSGSPQYMELFRPDAPWSRAAAHVQVFKIYPQWISRGTDDQLRQQFADLNRRHIQLALEWGVLADPTVHVEGFGGQTTMNAARRIARLGGTLSYIAMDEPLFFAHVFKGKGGPQWSIEKVVANAAANLKPVLGAYPNLRIGDIEPVNDAADAYTQGWKAFAAAGIPLAFFDADIDWNNPKSVAALQPIAAAARGAGLPFGIIYDGNSGDATSAAWLESAARHAKQAEATVGIPDIAIFQSWHAQPKKLLPESAADAFTNLIDLYLHSHGASGN